MNLESSVRTMSIPGGNRRGVPMPVAAGIGAAYGGVRNDARRLRSFHIKQVACANLKGPPVLS